MIGILNPVGCHINADVASAGAACTSRHHGCGQPRQMLPFYYAICGTPIIDKGEGIEQCRSARNIDRHHSGAVFSDRIRSITSAKEAAIGYWAGADIGDAVRHYIVHPRERPVAIEGKFSDGIDQLR